MLYEVITFLITVRYGSAGVHNLAGDVRSFLEDLAQLVHHTVKGTSKVLHSPRFHDSAREISFGNPRRSIRDIVEGASKRGLQIASKGISKSR